MRACRIEQAYHLSFASLSLDSACSGASLSKDTGATEETNTERYPALGNIWPRPRPPISPERGIGVGTEANATVGFGGCGQFLSLVRVHALGSPL